MVPVSEGMVVALPLGTGVAGAQEPGTQLGQGVKLQLTPSRDSGARGTATLTNVKDGVDVTLDMRGLPEAGEERANHFHGGGTCADDRAGNAGPVTIPLKTIEAEEVRLPARSVPLPAAVLLLGSATLACPSLRRR